jgi:hypothetical protein
MCDKTSTNSTIQGIVEKPSAPRKVPRLPSKTKSSTGGEGFIIRKIPGGDIRLV